MEDKFNLQRFVEAQAGSIEDVLIELRLGQKKGHWMWYIFPQVVGLGSSHISALYAIRSREEALAYLNHPILGSHLLECTKIINSHKCLTAEQIFGYPDYLKFRSCMTLFQEVSEKKNSEFSEALAIFYEGKPDKRTLSILQDSNVSRVVS